MAGNTYQIYKQGVWAMDMFTHLRVWMDYLELCLGRQLGDMDYVFPYLAPNGVLHPDREMTRNHVQELITEFAGESGLKKRFTTHSFRRGGAQYRFTHAPIGQRWSLNKVRWWGAWADGENVRVCLVSPFGLSS